MHYTHLTIKQETLLTALILGHRESFFAALRGMRLALGVVASVGSLIAANASQTADPITTPPAVPAPVSAAGLWTLERAISRAVEANPDILVARQEVERQEGARLQVRARMLPSVTMTAGINQRERGLVDVLPSQRADPPPPSRDTAVALFGYDVQIEFRQIVFDGFSTWNATQRQKLQTKQAFLNLRGVVTKTVSAVRQGFDAILWRTEGVAAERRRVEEFDQVVKLTERKRAVGDAPEFEALRAQAELAGARADLAEAIRAEKQAEQSFRRLLQISPSSESLNLSGGFAPRLFNLPFDEAVSKARASRPDLEAASVAVEAAQRNLTADAGSSYLPRIDAFATYGTRTSYYNSRYQLQGWTYGLSGQWNIFEGGAARGRRVSLRADLRSSRTRLAEAQFGIVSQLQELYQSLEQSRAAMEAQQTSVRTSERAARDAHRQYELGSANLEQVLQADITHGRAVSRFNEMVYNYNAIVASIELSVGGQVNDSLAVPSTWKQ